MHGNYALFITFAGLLCGVNSVRNARSEAQCLDYYASGKVYDLNELPAQMYGVYFWPPSQRERNSCEVVNFRKLSYQDAYSESSKCNTLNLPSNETVMKATYINSAGKMVNLLYYGDEEVKSMYRACDKIISKYLFVKVNDNYILGINCSAGGRGILLSKFLPRTSELQAVVDSIDIMTGREGSPDCKLSRR